MNNVNLSQMRQLLAHRLRIEPSTIPGINDTAARLKASGGYLEQDRMIDDKRKALNQAVKYSYQGAFITKVEKEIKEPVRALINPNRVKQDYDDKIVSVGYEHTFTPGDVFKWENTSTYWLIYLQDLTELAYFRGDIRKCRYNISWKDKEGNVQSTYAAIRGPIETKISSSQKDGISMDIPNLSLNILIPKTQLTLDAFKRYSKFFLNDLEFADEPIVWRIEAVDSFSMPGVLAINAIEYYYNKDKDDIEGGVVDGLPFLDKLPEIGNEDILGNSTIKPKKEYTYSASGDSLGEWSVEYGAPITLVRVDNHTVKLKWTSPLSGQFILKYGSFTKTITVESLF